jgi:hypothetical protein
MGSDSRVRLAGELGCRNYDICFVVEHALKAIIRHDWEYVHWACGTLAGYQWALRGFDPGCYELSQAMHHLAREQYLKATPNRRGFM